MIAFRAAIYAKNIKIFSKSKTKLECVALQQRIALRPCGAEEKSLCEAFFIPLLLFSSFWRRVFKKVAKF